MARTVAVGWTVQGRGLSYRLLSGHIHPTTRAHRSPLGRWTDLPKDTKPGGKESHTDPRGAPTHTLSLGGSPWRSRPSALPEQKGTK